MARGERLAGGVRRRMEEFYGADFSRVRVEEDARVGRMGARAVACGERIAFAPGEYQPETRDGVELIGHELAHVLQQAVGRARGGAGEVLNDEGLEREARRLGRMAAAGARRPAGWRWRAIRYDGGRAESFPVQACYYCGNTLCIHGEKCKLDPSLGGLFSQGTQSPFVGPHKDTKGYSQRGVKESEHMVPSKALSLSQVSYTYNTEPTISIPYDMHRGGVSGGGGGVSSTGSSHTASGWSAQLGSLIKQGDWKEAIRKAAVDEMNSAVCTGMLDEGMTSAIMQVVNGHAMKGRITQSEAEEINGGLYIAYLNWKSRGMAK